MVALSSGEAEVCSAVCGSSRLIGVFNVLKKMRVECWGDPMEHVVDASTCNSTSFYFAVDQAGLSMIQEAITEKRIAALRIHWEGESRKHSGVVLKRQGHAEERQDGGL